jgi:hypothetical protein
MQPRLKIDSDPQAEALMRELARRQEPKAPMAGGRWANWLIVALLAMIVLALFNRPQSQQSVVAPTPTPVPTPAPIVDRVPRAQLVNDHFAPPPVGHWFNVRMPDGRLVAALVKTPVSAFSGLPWSGNQIGDTRYVANEGHWYVWLARSAAIPTPTWIDP